MSNEQNELSIDESIEENEELNRNDNALSLIRKTTNQTPRHIVTKLLHFNNFNEKLIHLTKRKYKGINSQYFEEYYIINSLWMNNYLKYYNYNKISSVIKKKSNGEIKIEDLCDEIRRYSIHQIPGENNENNLSSINFEPIRENIPRNIYVEDISEKTLYYFDNFVILNKELYDEIKQDDGNFSGPNYNFTFSTENKINICLVDNLFIYKITDNILGIGILPEFLKNSQIPVFKIHFLIIIYNNDNVEEDEKYNSNREITQLFATGDLEKYLILDRGVRFENQNGFKQIEMKISKKKIGFLYNIENFNIEMYWKRTKEEFIKKQNELEEMKEIKKLKELEIKEKKKQKLILQREKELIEDNKIKQIEKEKMIKHK